jgi:hypothetical protein
MMPPMPITPLAPITWPTALLPSIRMLWQKTLFPGQVATDSKIRIASLLVLVILPAILLYPCLHFHLLDPDEGRYAESEDLLRQSLAERGSGMA